MKARKSGIAALDWPCFATGAAALPSIAGLYFADWDCPIACGGVAVLPGDIIVADGDGAVVLPQQLAEEVARDAPEQERFERFAQLKVEQGAPVTGLYPPDEATLRAYEAWCANGETGAGSNQPSEWYNTSIRVTKWPHPLHCEAGHPIGQFDGTLRKSRPGR